MDKRNIKSFLGLYPHLSEEKIRNLNKDRKIIEIPSVFDDDNPEKQILGLIFAPSPLTGMPMSDISVYLSEKTNPQVRDYVQRFLMSELPKVSTMTKDEDAALDSVISNRVQSMADWREVQKDLVKVAELSKEEYATFLANKKLQESKV